eukprot:8560678-Alexandrium_andersonii.AAC.1
MKRAAIIVNSERFMYIRPATDKKVSVLRVPLESYDFLKDESKHIYDKYLKGDMEAPESLAEDKEWSAQWLTAKLEAPPPQEGVVFVSNTAEQLWGGAASSAPVDPIRPPPDVWAYAFVPQDEVAALDDTRKVKRELEEDFHDKAAKLAKAMRGNFINVDKGIAKSKSTLSQDFENPPAEAPNDSDSMGFRNALLHEKHSDLA